MKGNYCLKLLKDISNHQHDLGRNQILYCKCQCQQLQNKNKQKKKKKKKLLYKTKYNMQNWKHTYIVYSEQTTLF